MDEEHICRSALELLIDAGIDNPPVDLDRIAAHLGVQIRYHRLPKVVPGFLYPGGFCPVIVVNRGHCETRQRFTVAHEFWHVLRGEGGLMLYSETHSDSPWEERAANRFAAEVLMPAQWVEKAAGYGYGFDEAAEKFNVSRQALVRQLRCLNVRLV